MKRSVRLLLLSDQVHPHIHSPRFPENLPPFDLVLAAGDLPGEYRLALKPLPLLLPRRLLLGHGLDVLLTHAPPPGPTSGEDFAHRGAGAFLLLHRLYRPRLHVHGHTPLLGANPKRRHRTPLGVEVVHAQGYALIAL